MNWKTIDFSKIPFLKFIAYYSSVISGYIIFIIGIQTLLSLEKELNYGVYACLLIQVLATILKIFFLNQNLKYSIAIQYIIFGIEFLLNIILVYILTLTSHNVIAISGFFFTYFFHLKILILLGYKLSKTQ